MAKIVLKLAGPLQSWGGHSHYNHRDTNLMPTKSGILGMLAAALGYRRNDDKLLNTLRKINMGVRVDQPGNLLTDLQITRAYKPYVKKKHSFVTHRDYLEDAVFMVALECEDNDFMYKIYDALKHPYFALSLGRRSAPVNVDFLLPFNIQPKDNLVNFLINYKWQAANFYKNKHSNDSLDVYVDNKLLKNNNPIFIKDDPVSFSSYRELNNPNNMYSYRNYDYRSITNFQVSPVY